MQIIRMRYRKCKHMKRSPLKRSTKPMKRTAMKPSRPKKTAARSSAREQECTLRFPGCNYRTDTTVLCHSNLLEHGKGMGLKAPDKYAAYGCCACHDMLDGRARRPDWFSYEDMIAGFLRAMEATQEIMQKLFIA